MTKAALLYITTPDQDTAKSIASSLLEMELIACANILPSCQSLYRWEGATHNDEETVLILKTRHSLVEKVSKEVVARHPYECPCVVALPISPGNPAFLQWIGEATQ